MAIALLKYLAEYNLLTVATTHYGELKTLKYQDSRFENASVEFDDVSLQPTYRLLWGIPGRSNALTIAQRLGLSSAIVDEARQLVGGYSQDINQLIAALENQRREQETKYRQAGQLLQETERFYEEVCQKASSLQQRERDLRLSQEKAVREMILQAKEEIARVIRQLQRQGSPTARDAHQATMSLQQIGDRYLPPPEQESTAKAGYKPKLGERVKVLSIGQTAEVINIEEGEEQLTVRFGLMKMSVPLTDIESKEGKKGEAPVKPQPTPPPLPTTPTPKQVTTVRTSQNSIDIRGQRVHHAEAELEKAIAAATEMGVLWIIHGKGTGRLREGVHEFLRRHPQVSRFELAPPNEGGAGVTIAYLV